MADSASTHLAWLDPQWQAQARAWVQMQLEHSGRRRIGPIEQPHVRPWSTAWRIPTDAGPVWFKANGAGSAYEPGLLQALAAWVPERVLQPLAVNIERGWSLQPDGGATLRAVLGREQDLSYWERALPCYAELQMTVTARVEELLAIGVPDRRPAAMPALFEQLLLDRAWLRIDAEDGLAPQTHERLLRLMLEFQGWCEELDQLGIGLSVQHDDLHDGNVFFGPEGYRFFDWGDASIGHPFCTLLVTLRSVAYSFQIPSGDRRLQRLVDAYFEPFTAKHDRSALMHALNLAFGIAKLSRALSWRRVLGAMQPEQRGEFEAAVPGWLAELLEPNPL